MLFVVVAILVIGGVAVYATGRWGAGLPPVEPDRRPEERDGRPAFDVVVRGYRMDEVDARIADLERQVADLRQQGSRASRA